LTKPETCRNCRELTFGCDCSDLVNATSGYDKERIRSPFLEYFYCCPGPFPPCILFALPVSYVLQTQLCATFDGVEQLQNYSRCEVCAR
jgi:hypothetical protein